MSNFWTIKPNNPTIPVSFSEDEHRILREGTRRGLSAKEIISLSVVLAAVQDPIPPEAWVLPRRGHRRGTHRTSFQFTDAAFYAKERIFAAAKHALEAEQDIVGSILAARIGDGRIAANCIRLFGSQAIRLLPVLTPAQHDELYAAVAPPPPTR